MAGNVSLGSVPRIMSNLATSIIFTLFMLGVTYTAYTMDYVGAAIFFVIIALLSLFILYRKVANELIRERYSTQ